MAGLRDVRLVGLRIGAPHPSLLGFRLGRMGMSALGPKAAFSGLQPLILSEGI